MVEYCVNVFTEFTYMLADGVPSSCVIVFCQSFYKHNIAQELICGDVVNRI